MAVVYLTSQLESYLRSIEVDPDEFREEFERWRHQWPSREYSSELFGKDSAYCSPTVDGEPYSLRHAHIAPGDPEQLESWHKIFRRFGRKTSDRHLVYYHRDDDAYLLIHILEDGIAHEIASMRTREDRVLMETLAIIAEDFEVDGEYP